MKILPYIDGLHVLPWLTDGAINFLDCYIFYLKQNKGINPKIFEFGGGGSTLYFASRGCSTITVEHDEEWAQKLIAISSIMGYEDLLDIRLRPRPYQNEINNNVGSFDIIVIDGRDRILCLKAVLVENKASCSLIVFDNSERVVGKYRELLQLTANFNLIHFEQPYVLGTPTTPEGTSYGLDIKFKMPSNGLAAGVHRDRAGNSNKGRSVTSILIPKSFGEFTTEGIPLLNK